MEHKTVECYVDDLAVKSKRKEDHLQDLREVFLRLRKHKLRMSPLKCLFGVSSKCEAAFQDIKSYLTKPSVLAAAITGKPFILYTRALNYSLGTLLAQKNDGGKEAALYYLSRILVDAEHRYSPVEKECLAVMFAVQKLRQYLLSNTVYLISRINLLKVLVTKAGSLNTRLAKWSILLSQFDIRYVPQKAIKGQALANFLAEHPLPKDFRLGMISQMNLSTAWRPPYQMPPGTSEYQALILRLELALESGITMLEAFGDSKLIVNQMNQKYEIRKPDLLPYYNKAQSLRQKFDIRHITHIRRGENIRVDALARLAASIAIQEGENMQITVCQRRILPPINTHQAIAECHQVVGSRISILKPPISDWRDPFIDYIMFGILPEDPKEWVSIQRRAPNFYLDIPSKMLYRKSFNGVLLRCLSQQEAEETLRKVHAGLCGAHQAGPKLYDQIKRLAISWPFEAWGMDIIGPISPPSSKGHRFIFAATDYFSKWSEAFAFSEMKTLSIIQFLRTNIICRFVTKETGATLAEALWAYRTTVRGPTHSTPFSLVYGCKAVVPLEVQIPSLRVSLQNEITQESNVKLRLQELDNLDERRLEALQSVELYQARMAGSFDKKVRQRAHKKGDLVLAVKRPMVFAHKSKGKFEPKSEGPFVIDKVSSTSAYALLNIEGDRCMLPINGKFLKRYYP
ncbi:hypothetical protein MRB53_030333 [Persea americana]|uniref:Uncharacterized protein n=1 Tax=Persea americana TaxID=3435 RepID=A0ACC2KKZ5_PERAE|nr:hypothetical protein MRB53_030333 [Persea americana]